MEENIPLHIEISKDLKAEAKAAAAMRQISLKEWITEAIKEKLGLKAND
jgi:predicted HicB family RNase H-like nuclease